VKILVLGSLHEAKEVLRDSKELNWTSFEQRKEENSGFPEGPTDSVALRRRDRTSRSLAPLVRMVLSEDRMVRSPLCRWDRLVPLLSSAHGTE
jgi:hypothetical protein